MNYDDDDMFDDPAWKPRWKPGKGSGGLNEDFLKAQWLPKHVNRVCIVVTNVRRPARFGSTGENRTAFTLDFEFTSISAEKVKGSRSALTGAWNVNVTNANILSYFCNTYLNRLIDAIIQLKRVSYEDYPDGLLVVSVKLSGTRRFMGVREARLRFLREDEVEDEGECEEDEE